MTTPVDIANARVCFVVPCFNETELLASSLQRLVAVAENLGQDSYVLVVDDGSRPATVTALREESRQYESRVHVIELARNYGHQLALWCGLEHAQGDYVVVLDFDLQDPPEIVPEMLATLLASGADSICGKRSRREGEPIWKKTVAALYYRVLTRLNPATPPRDVGDFRIYSRAVVDQLLARSDRSPYLRGLIYQLGINEIKFDYVRAPRAAGESQYTIAKLTELAFNGFLLAPKPLAQWIFLLGIVLILIAVPIALCGHGGTAMIIASLGIVQMTLGWIAFLLGSILLSSQANERYSIRKRYGHSLDQDL